MAPRSEAEGYFSRIEEILQTSPSAPGAYRKIEDELDRLSPAAWQQLKKKCKSYLYVRDPIRGWNQLVACLNEAKGYVLLEDLGFTQITFLPEGNGSRCDLTGKQDHAQALLEVKTMNPGAEELRVQRDREWLRRQGKSVEPFDIESYELDDRLTRAISETVQKAAGHLKATQNQTEDRLLILLVVNLFFENIKAFDDSLRRFCHRILPAGLELVVERPPARFPVVLHSRERLSRA